MCRRSKSDCDDCFRREDAAIAMQPDFPTVGVGVQQVARRWRSSRRREGGPQICLAPRLRHSLAAHVRCATSAAPSALQWLFVLLCLFFSRRPQHKHKHRLCPEWLAASVCTPSLHEYARGMPPTANPCIASSDADADTASASPLTQSPQRAARSSQLSASETITPWQRVRDRDHGCGCMCAPPHLLARGAAARSSALPSSPSHMPANHSALTRIALHPV
jgi:hypothetical protein